MGVLFILHSPLASGISPSDPLSLTHSLLSPFLTVYISLSYAHRYIQEVKQVANLVSAAGGGMDGGGDSNRLELLESIGGGAHGTVWRGRWRNMNVAVKTVLFPFEHGASDGSAKARAVLEAGVSCSVSHPNVIATVSKVHISSIDTTMML